MIKTQVQLEEWQYRAAKQESARSSKSLSALVREGLSLVLRRSGRPAAPALEDLAGKYEPQACDDLKAHDRGWVESIR